jgi:hypothetical protein
MDKNPVTPLQMLFIRACKSNNPQKRLQRLYHAFYGCSIDIPQAELNMHISNNLMDICERYELTKLRDVMAVMNPSHYISRGYAPDTPYWEMVSITMSNVIRFTEVKQFPGMRLPRKFRTPTSS